MATIEIRWPNEGAAVHLDFAPAETARNLAGRLARSGRPLNTRCGQRGACAGCTVSLVAGEFRLAHGRLVAAPAEVQACQGDALPGAVVAVPARAAAFHAPEIVTTFRVGVPSALDPLVPVAPGTADHGLAIDVGTTTVAVALVDLTTGRIVREASALNRQVEFGDDVVTRIHHAGTSAGRHALRQAILRDTLLPLVTRLGAAAGIALDRVAAAGIAGNTTMLHLLAGVDPTSLGVAPFRPVFVEQRRLTAGELGFSCLGPDIPLQLLPGCSAYVGADVVAGCVCSGLPGETGPVLLLDIGTNGELVLQHAGRVLATATAAGPAFEGGRLLRGTRAVPGAIAHVALSGGAGSPRVELVRGASQPAGLCGTAYVDFLAEGRRTGLLSATGRFERAAWHALAPAHRESHGGSRGVRLCAGDPATTVTEADLAHLLQAKAAIAAGIAMLLRRADLAPREVGRLYLAGGFGLNLDVRNAIACGLLPGFAPAQVTLAGNTALGGAWLALTDRAYLREMDAFARAAQVIALNQEQGFEDTFIDHLLLPPALTTS